MDYVGYALFGFFYWIMLNHSVLLGLLGWLVWLFVSLVLIQRVLLYFRK
jgi:hypothetical protein